MKTVIKHYLNLLIAFLIIGCAEINDIYVAPALAPYIPIDELLKSPDTIQIDGRKLYLRTYLWRDFQPISPPDGKPLIALEFITALDSMPFPSSITSDAVWIVNGDMVWKSWFSNETLPPGEPFELVKIAREGPKWGPGITVSVIVRIFNAQNKEYFLRASNQWISSTWDGQ